ncbi:hypothetical protein BS47DRAFT_1353936, partial [Hydnum rufescens UP504]
IQAQASWSSSLFFSPLMVLYKILNWGPPWSNTNEIYINLETEQLKEFKPAFPLAKVFTFSSYHTFTRISD